MKFFSDSYNFLLVSNFKVTNFFASTSFKLSDIEENPGVLDQCYSNNNFVKNAVLGVRNSNVLLETRLRENFP